MINELLKNKLSEYQSFFKEEIGELKKISLELGNKLSLLDRKNFNGHVISSGFILSDNKILLIFHKKIQKYIQPGGHVDEIDKDIYDTAKREIFEETGLNVNLHNWHYENNFIPINIDTHLIPENNKKQEPQHFHYDFNYVFTIDKNMLDLVLNKDEVDDFKWVEINSDFDEKLLNNVCQKIKKLNLDNIKI